MFVLAALCCKLVHYNYLCETMMSFPFSHRNHTTSKHHINLHAIKFLSDEDELALFTEIFV